MNYIKKIFSSYQSVSKDKHQEFNEPVSLSLDDAFVHHFINKGGKFLYATSMQEIGNHFHKILLENKWDKLFCCDNDLLKITSNHQVSTQSQYSQKLPFFLSCEHLISNSGNILFSSNQLGSNRMNSFSENFIVYATTSQIVSNISEGLTGIKENFEGNIPSNICSLKNYTLKQIKESPVEFSNSNTKNLYLLLFEDL